MARQIPTISLHDFEGRLHSDIAPQLTAAARDVGFFLIENHGIPQEEIDAAFAVGRKILDAPDAVKGKYPFNADNYLGWRGVDDIHSVTGTKLWEWFSVGRWGLESYNCKEQRFDGEKWVDELGEDFRGGALAWQAHAHDLAIKILCALWIGLGRDEAEIHQALEFDSAQAASILAWNHYPAVSKGEQDRLRKEHGGQLPPRLHAHADGGVLTILFQREGEDGLEIAPGNAVENVEALAEDVGNIWNAVPVAKEWTPLPPKPGCFAVNVGDTLMRWSDGKLKSTYHRVRGPLPTDPNPYGPRYSMPYFFQPKFNYTVQGPKKVFQPITGFEIVSGIGNAYANRRNSEDNKWQENAYLDEVAGPAASAANGANSASSAAANGSANGSSNGNSTGTGAKKAKKKAGAAARAQVAAVRAPRRPAALRPLQRSTVLGGSLRFARLAL